MRLKNIVSVILACTIVFLCGCARVDTLSLNKEKTPTGYTASYSVTASSSKAEGGVLKYTNVYTVAVDETKNELVISSIADEPWSNGKEGEDLLEGRQIIKTISRLKYTDEGFGVPVYIEQEFSVDVDKTYYTHFSFEHDHELNAAFLRTKEYASNSETGFKEETYSVAVGDQYFDKDSIQFIIASFPEDTGVIEISSGNRNSLQAVKYEFMENEAVVTDAGTFNCRVVRIRPNTNFSVNSARIYFDSLTGIPVKVEQDTSSMVLTSFSFN
jgi:outer membrane lipoprotein-sorting protein